MSGLRVSNALATHHTIATGYYAKQHGVCGHITWGTDINMKTQNSYVYNKELYSFDETIMPIWALNQFNGGRSGCIMWPGCEFEYADERISYIMKYNSSIPIGKRFKTIVKWLNSSLSPPNLIMVYINEPDTLAHVHGPNSREVKKMIKRIDIAQGYLFDKIRQLGLQDIISIIYLTDHLVYPVQFKNFVNTTVQYGKLCQLVNFKYFADVVQQELVPTHTNVKICTASFLKDMDYVLTASSAEYNGIRLTNSIFATDESYVWAEPMEKYVKIAESLNKTITATTKFGAHGYTYDYKWRNLFFMAKGRVFIKGVANTEIEMTDFYVLFVNILRIPGRHQHKGNFSRIAPLLIHRNKEMIDWTKAILIIPVLALIHCLIFYFSVNIYNAINKEKKSNKDPNRHVTTTE